MPPHLLHGLPVELHPQVSEGSRGTARSLSNVTFSLSLTISCPQCGHTSILPPQGVTPTEQDKKVLNECRNAGPAGLVSSIAVVQTPQSCSDLTVQPFRSPGCRRTVCWTASCPCWTGRSARTALDTAVSGKITAHRRFSFASNTKVNFYYLDIRYLLFKVLNILPTKSWELWNSLGAVAV